LEGKVEHCLVMPREGSKLLGKLFACCSLETIRMVLVATMAKLPSTYLTLSATKKLDHLGIWLNIEYLFLPSPESLKYRLLNVFPLFITILKLKS